MTFQLVPALGQKDFICDLPLSCVLFEDNTDYPWVMLVPRKEGVRNMLDLTTDERLTLMKEIEVCERALMNLYHPDQTNVAMIGIKTPQLHVHVLARFKTDPHWPETVWGYAGHPCDPTEKANRIDQLKKEILVCQKSLF